MHHHKACRDLVVSVLGNRSVKQHHNWKQICLLYKPSTTGVMHKRPPPVPVEQHFVLNPHCKSLEQLFMLYPMFTSGHVPRFSTTENNRKY